MDPKILLIMPRHREYEKVFPYGIATVYSVLREHDFKVDLIDCENRSRDLPELIDPSQLSQYDVVGVSGLISSYKTVKRDVVPYVRKHAPRALIIIGGYLGISAVDLLLKNRLGDVVFSGDAEESILEFLDVWHRREMWSGIAGIAFRDGEGKIVNTGVRMLDTLENFHVPFYKHLDIERYNAHKRPEEKSYPLVVEVGCPYQCEFCFNSFGNRTRNRSPEHVIEEIRTALRKYGYPKIDLMAENLLLRRKWVRRFCGLMDEYDLKFEWSASGHANCINEDILKLVKSHGCTHIGIGFENFSQKILDNMNKRTRVETYVKVIRLLRKHKFTFSGTCIFGYFGEDQETLRENVDFIEKYFFHTYYHWIQAYPLTVLYNKCIEKGLIGNEEEYIERLGEATDFVINLTEFPDGELFEMRAEIDRACENATKIRPSVLFRAARLYGLWWVVSKLPSAFERLVYLLARGESKRKLRLVPK